MTEPVRSVVFTLVEMFIAGVAAAFSLTLGMQGNVTACVVFALITIILLIRCISKMYMFNGFIGVTAEMLDAFAMYILGSEESVNKVLKVIVSSDKKEGKTIKQTIYDAIDSVKSNTAKDTDN